MSLGEPKQFTGAERAELLKKQEAYNDKDYHQPSDQYDPSWDFTGGVNDMRVLAQLGWRIAQQAEMPNYNAGDQFAEVQEVRITIMELVTLEEIRAARERIKSAARLHADAGSALARRQRLRKPQDPSLSPVPEVREPAADGRVQDSRRLQHDLAAAEGRSWSAA